MNDVDQDMGTPDAEATAALTDLSNRDDAAAVCDDEVFRYNDNHESLSPSGGKENKENRSFMKRMLGGRNLRSRRSSSKLSSKCSREESSLSQSSYSKPIEKSEDIRKNLGLGKEDVVNDNKSKLLTTSASGPRTRQQLSRSQLLPAVTSPLPAPQSLRVVSKNSQGGGMKSDNVPKKNFVKANVLAAANTKVKSSTYLEVPVLGPSTRGGNNLSQTGKKFGSSKSLNSDPGTGTSSGTLSFSRGTADHPQRKSYHVRSNNSNCNSGSATLSRNFGKQKNSNLKSKPTLSSKPNTQNLPISSKPNTPKLRVERSGGENRSPKPPRPTSRQTQEIVESNHLKVEKKSNRHSSPSSSPSSAQLSRRSSFSSIDSEILKGLKQKQEHFELLIENLQTDFVGLKSNFERVEQEKQMLREDFRLEISELTQKFQVEKQELRNEFLYQLETQRSELRDEIRKLLSFKENVPNTEVANDKSGGKSKSFKDSKEKLFNKIHRLSARMSMQDIDMKEMQEVKSWNEKKLENELTRFQGSVKKPTTSTEILDEDQKMMWTCQQGCLEEQLALAAN